MPRLAKQKRHLASIAQAGGMAPKRPKAGPKSTDSTPIGGDQAFLSEYEEESDGRWEVDESGDSDVSSDSDDDKVLHPLHS
jgi:hypothetical protein